MKCTNALHKDTKEEQHSLNKHFFQLFIENKENRKKKEENKLAYWTGRKYTVLLNKFEAKRHTYCKEIESTLYNIHS